MNGTPTTTVHFGDDDEGRNYRADDTTDTLSEFVEGVEEGDYVAVVLRSTPESYSKQRSMGHVSEVETVDGRFDSLRFEVEEATGDSPEEVEAYLHLNPNTGDYYFTDGRDGEVPADGHPVESLSWTPEEHVVEA